MEAKKNQTGLDAMAARSATDVLGIVRGAATAQADGRLPFSMWKTGQARSDAASADRERRGVPTGMWKTGWDAHNEGAA